MFFWWPRHLEFSTTSLLCRRFIYSYHALILIPTAATDIAKADETRHIASDADGEFKANAPPVVFHNNYLLRGAGRFSPLGIKDERLGDKSVNKNACKVEGNDCTGSFADCCKCHLFNFCMIYMRPLCISHIIYSIIIYYIIYYYYFVKADF